MAFPPGEDPDKVAELRVLVGHVCHYVSRYGNVLSELVEEYPTVQAAIAALQTACILTGFDQPNELGPDSGSSGFGLRAALEAPPLVKRLSADGTGFEFVRPPSV